MFSSNIEESRLDMFSDIPYSIESLIKKITVHYESVVKIRKLTTGNIKYQYDIGISKVMVLSYYMSGQFYKPP